MRYHRHLHLAARHCPSVATALFLIGLAVYLVLILAVV